MTYEEDQLKEFTKKFSMPVLTRHQEEKRMVEGQRYDQEKLHELFLGSEKKKKRLVQTPPDQSTSASKQMSTLQRRV